MLGFLHEILSLRIKTYFNNIVINLSFISGIFFISSVRMLEYKIL